MAAEAFKVVSWSPLETITNEKLNAMVNNDNWLKQQMVRGHFGAYNKVREDGLRIAAGLAIITARKPASATVNVNFGGFFTPDCRPVVTTGILSKSQRKIFCTIDGPGTELHPTSNGFQVHVVVEAAAKAQRKISRNFYVSWHALGY